MNKFEFGLKAKDIISGFTGIITGHSDYITGCDQYLLVPQVKEDNSAPESKWYDENRIEIMSREQQIVLDTELSQGACESAPIK